MGGQSQSIAYDYEAAEDETATADVSSYRALVETEGICQSFAAAYAYLLLQCGIEANTCGGSSEAAAHEWSIIKLDDQYYYADPTFECDSDVGVKYFGMTTKKRVAEGDFDIESFNIGYNSIGGEGVKADSERFKELWDVWKVTDMKHEAGNRIINYLDMDEAKHTFSTL